MQYSTTPAQPVSNRPFVGKFPDPAQYSMPGLYYMEHDRDMSGPSVPDSERTQADIRMERADLLTFEASVKRAVSARLEALATLELGLTSVGSLVAA